MSGIVRTPSPHSYSRAVAAGDFVFLGLHRGFGEDAADQVNGALDGIGATLAEHGAGLDTLVSVHVWLRDATHVPAMEDAFRDRFEPGGYPARMTSTTDFLDDDCLVMIDGVAFRG